MAELYKIVDFLDKYFKVADIKDSSNNGLQVEGAKEVKKVGLIVDAASHAFEQAKDCQMLIAHHGVSWTDSLKYITGVNYKRIRALIKDDMSLYALHHPLDIHPELGHGAKFFEVMGWSKDETFGMMDGMPFGFRTSLVEEKDINDISAEIEKKLNTTCLVYDYGQKQIKTIGFVSGGGGFCVEEATKEKLDLAITGERHHKAVLEARDLSQSVLFAGHYKTEVLGIVAIGALLEKEFGLETEFIESAPR